MKSPGAQTELQCLGSFQDAFAAALMIESTGIGGPFAKITAQPGFAVYRNAVMRGCIDALRANYPAVLRLVGEEWFAAVAAEFVRAHPPRTTSLIEYDDRFAAFLATFAPAAELPYLADVAILDAFWTQAHVSADEACVAASRVAEIDSHALARCALRPHGSARWRAFDGPAFSIWRSNRDPAARTNLADLEWRGEGALIVRPFDTVESLEIDAATCAFLDACGRGMSLAEASAAALGVTPDTDLAALLERLLRASAFGRLENPTHDHNQVMS